MRTQKIITIDTNVYERNEDEGHLEFAQRQDRALNNKLEMFQASMPEWDLLSVATAGSEFPTGFYTSLWEYDTERYKGVKPEIELFISMCGLAFGTEEARLDHYVRGCDKCEELHAPECQNHDHSKSDEDDEIMAFDSTDECETDVKWDGDTTPHIQFGEVIRVNGVRFRLVDFAQTGSGASVEFLDEREYDLLEQSRVEAEQFRLQGRPLLPRTKYRDYGPSGSAPRFRRQ